MEFAEKHLFGKRQGADTKRHGEKPLKGDVQRYAKVILISVALGEAVTMGVLFLLSLIMCKVDLPLLVMDFLVIAAGALGALASGYLCGRILREKGMIFGLVCGGVLLFILLLLNIGFHQETSVLFLCGKVAGILVSAGLGGILGVNRKKRIKY